MKLCFAILLQFAIILPMDVPLSTFVGTLQQNGFSVTKPRKLIFTILDSNDPLTMADIIKACNSKLDRVTVYRTIDLFEKLHIVQKLNMGWKYKVELSSPYQLHHHHLTCLGCSRIVALPEDKILESRLSLLAESEDFKALDHQLEIRGYCQTCAK